MTILERNSYEAIERILELVDEGTFNELGAKVVSKKDNVCESDGVVTGYALINGFPCFIYSQDSGTMGGTFGKAHADKIVNLIRLARKAKAPVIGILDSNGFRLDEGAVALDAFAGLYKASAEARNELLHIGVIKGKAVGGMAVYAQNFDFLYVEDNGELYLLNKEKEIYGDVIAKTDVTEEIKKIIGMMPAYSDCMPGHISSADDLNRKNTGIEKLLGNAKALAGELSDFGKYVEYRSGSGQGIGCFVVEFDGIKTGLIAGNCEGGKISADACSIRKAESFVSLCNKFKMPVVTITATGVFGTDEKALDYDARAISEFANSLCKTKVPKINVIVGASTGSMISLFNSKGLGADMTLMWDNAEISVVDSVTVAQTLSPELNLLDTSVKAFEYEKNNACADVMAHLGYTDMVILPEESRKYIIGALEMFDDLF